MANSNKNVRIGYYMSKGKAKKLDWDNFVKLAKEERNIDVVPIVLDDSLEGQGHFDLLVHKVTDEISDKDNASAQQKVRFLEEYLRNHPGVVEVDPLVRQKPLVDRGLMSQLLNQLNTQLPVELGVHCPQYVIVEKSLSDYSDVLAAAWVKFPVVCKTIQACGSKAAHEMGIVFSEKKLHSFSVPFMVQEYINHNAVIFKVFVIGEFVDVVQRASLRNVALEESDTLFFDSQQPLPSALLAPATETKLEVPTKTIHAMADFIRKKLGLSLFGFDVITDAASGKHACIDVNYFPVSHKGFMQKLARIRLTRTGTKSMT